MLPWGNQGSLPPAVSLERFSLGPSLLAGTCLSLPRAIPVPQLPGAGQQKGTNQPCPPHPLSPEFEPSKLELQGGCDAGELPGGSSPKKEAKKAFTSQGILPEKRGVRVNLVQHPAVWGFLTHFHFRDDS